MPRAVAIPAPGGPEVRQVIDRGPGARTSRLRGRARALPLRVAAALAPERAVRSHELIEAGGLRGRAVIVF